MSNIEYIKQKVIFYGKIESTTEAIAKLYLEGLGFDVYYSSKLFDFGQLKSLTQEKMDQLTEIVSIGKLGIPDLIIIKDNIFTFVEVKKISDKFEDALSQSQLNWIQEHSQCKVIVLGFEIEIKESRDIVIKELERDINDLKKQILELRYQLNEKRNDFDKRVQEKSRNNLIDKFNELIRELDKERIYT